jgi:hypothetical protein
VFMVKFWKTIYVLASFCLHIQQLEKWITGICLLKFDTIHPVVCR